jgi:diguanylate cyclase (GGDEF)-like protein
VTAVLESTSDSIVVIDSRWVIEFINQRAFELLASNANLKLGTKWRDAFPEAVDNGSIVEKFERAMRERASAKFEEFYDGKWFDIRIYPTAGGGLSIFFRDISEARLAREELQRLAERDSLTGLANRNLFQTRLKELVDSRAHFAVILLDVDHFKEVNDTLGHPVGDVLLQATGERLLATLRPGDLVARLGGDEFVFIAEGAGAAEAARLAQRLTDVAAIPHSVEGETIRLGASIGIALSDGSATDPARIFRNADIALYAAKASGRGAFRVFEPSMETGMLERQALRADLRAAIEKEQFELNFQPLVDLHSGKVATLEALLRWHHPTRGRVPPDQFIPIAEESGLIVAIGEWVINRACAEAMKWPSHVSVAVNISTREFASGELAHNVRQALKRTGLEAGRLELEITETVLLKNSRANLATLHLLREQGVRIALDDFGTGYSSLAYLQQFPFSKIKIDRSFISGLPGSDASQAIVRSVIGLGMALGMRVTAEGVETQEQFDWVRLGCNEAQGYYISPPVGAAEVPELIARIEGVGGAAKKRAAVG